MGFLSKMLGLSAPKSEAVQAAERTLSPPELKALQEEFRAVAGGEAALDLKRAAELFPLGEAHGAGLTAMLLPRLLVDRPADGFTAGDYTVAKVRVRGGDSAWQEYLFHLLAGGDSPGEGAISRDTLAAALEGSLRVALKREGVDGALVARAVEGALAGRGALDLRAWCAWSKANPLLAAALRCVLAGGRAEVLAQPALEPCAAGDAFLASPRCQMSPALAAMLCCGMPARQRATWELLFHSDKHGKSFNTLLACVGGRGATLLLVTDKAGNTFGGFAGQPWAKAGTFTGDFSCFVFSLHPAAAIYRPSGVNENFQWCGQGFNSLPNGIGFGGQTGYYAVFVDDTLDKGMTRQAATYNNPPFAKEQVFEVDCVECWLVEPSEEELEQREKHGTAMDRYKETNKFLNLTGVQNDHSAAYRDDRPHEVEDNTSKFR